MLYFTFQFMTIMYLITYFGGYPIWKFNILSYDLTCAELFTFFMGGKKIL